MKAQHKLNILKFSNFKQYVLSQPYCQHDFLKLQFTILSNNSSSMFSNKDKSIYRKRSLSPKSMQIQMLSKQVLLPIDSVWNHHCDSVLQPDQ